MRTLVSYRYVIVGVSIICIYFILFNLSKSYDIYVLPRKVSDLKVAVVSYKYVYKLFNEPPQTKTPMIFIFVGK